MTVGDDKDRSRSHKELFIEAIETLTALVAETKKVSSTFVGRHYLPFMLEMKRRGFTEAFGNLVLYTSGDHSVKPWLDANKEKMSEFLAWAKAYRPPAN